MDPLFAEGLRFFGRINAAISHELRNIMAAISETAGLLDDLAQLSEKGTPLETESVRTCCQAVVEEIQRGFATIRLMNTFAHSTDEPVASVSLSPLIQLMADLSQFLNQSRPVELDLSEVVDITVTTRPLFLENFLFQIFFSAFRGMSPSQKLTLTARPGKNGVVIIFSRQNKFSEDDLPIEGLLAVAGVLDAEFKLNLKKNEITARIPCSIKTLV